VCKIALLVAILVGKSEKKDLVVDAVKVIIRDHGL
jgi:hypothetical protein